MCHIQCHVLIKSINRKKLLVYFWNQKCLHQQTKFLAQIVTFNKFNLQISYAANKKKDYWQSSKTAKINAGLNFSR